MNVRRVTAEGRQESVCPLGKKQDESSGTLSQLKKANQGKPLCVLV